MDCQSQPGISLAGRVVAPSMPLYAKAWLSESPDVE